MEAGHKGVHRRPPLNYIGRWPEARLSALLEPAQAPNMQASPRSAPVAMKLHPSQAGMQCQSPLNKRRRYYRPGCSRA
jgi:hypothetical protein